MSRKSKRILLTLASAAATAGSATATDAHDVTDIEAVFGYSAVGAAQRDAHAQSAASGRTPRLHRDRCVRALGVDDAMYAKYSMLSKYASLAKAGHKLTDANNSVHKLWDGGSSSLGCKHSQ